MTPGRTRLPEGLLAGVLVAVWLAAFVLHVHSAATGRLAWVGVFVDSPAAGEYPVVESLRQGTRAEESGLRVGDRLTAADGVDLRGVGPVDWFALALARADDALELPLDVLRGGVPGHLVLRLSPVAVPWRSVPLAVAFVVTACLVLRRRPGNPVARAFFLASMATSLHWMFFFGREPAVTRLWVVYQGLTGLLLFPLILRCVLLFPEEVAPPGERLPWWPWAFVAFGPVATSWAVGVPFPAAGGLLAAFVLNLAFLVATLGVMTRNYRRASGGGRRKLRWVLYGFYVGTLPLVIANVVSVFVPRLWWLHEVAATAMVLVPICIVIAIVRDNLLDVDRLISATTAYSILSVLLVFALLTVVPWAAEQTSALLGTSTGSAQTLLSLLVAAAIVPGQRTLQPWIDRLFFAERHALEAGFHSLLDEFGRATTPDRLLNLLGRRLDELLAPTGCAIYAGGLGGEDLDLVVARGAAASWPTRTALGGDRATASATPPPRAPISLDDPRGAHALALVAGVAPQDLAACGVATVLPFTRGPRLAGLVCLGPKRSGDSLVPGEKALLGAVAEKVSDALLRFDEAEILHREQEMGRALRRYVPSPVAERLARGARIEGGEQDLAVLFVDVRGYTALSAKRGAGDVFSIVNRYTEVVADRIRRHGGTVLEFLGDGLMAVFGAPEPLENHARAAVEAARAVVEVVGELRLPAADGGPGQDGLAVGVGIATGRAFVGDVETGDRLVFTALGDTVNLASRLQGLTRELAASVAIDRATHLAAGPAAADFVARGEIPIRGRPEAIEVWTLSLPAAAH